MIKMFIFTTSEAITDNPTVIDLMDTIAKLTKIVEDLKASSAANNKAIEQNTKRHENVDFSLNNLCSLIDEIFDADNHPGSTKYDCCHEFYTGTQGQIGNAMFCTSQSFLSVSGLYPTSATGFCATTCGKIPINWEEISYMLKIHEMFRNTNWS